MGSSHGLQIASVGPFSGAIDIGGERALMTLHDVVVTPARGHAGGEAEGEQSRDAREGEHRQPAHGDAGNGPLAARGQEIHGVAAPRQLAHQPRGGGLDTPMKDEGPADERELHRRAGRLTSPVTRGKRSRRAAVKL